jgi:hypothetical protein
VAASCGYDRAARGKSRLNIGQSQMWLSSASMLAEVGSRLKPEWSHSCRNTSATNHKDEFSQMTKWLERRERIQHLSSFIDWTQEHREPCQKSTGSAGTGTLTIKMARNPSKGRVLFDVLAEDYGALDFQDALADFIAQANNPGASGAALRHRAHDTHIPFSGVPVYHNMKFTNGSESDIVDVVHVRPEQNDSRGRIIPGRFDTALVNGNKGNVSFTNVLLY